jgi:hypothetical protein
MEQLERFWNGSGSKRFLSGLLWLGWNNGWFGFGVSRFRLG